MSSANGLPSKSPDFSVDEVLATSLAGFDLEQPFTNAAGTCKTLERVEMFARVVPIIMVGSIHGTPPTGEGQVTPGPGLDYYGENIPKMVELARKAGKPLAVSVAGFGEYGDAARLAHDGEADIIELNLGFPNVWSAERQEYVTSLDIENIAEVVSEVEQCVPNGHPLGLKLPHYPEPGTLNEVAATISELPIQIHYVAALGLAQVSELRKLLPERIQLVGVEKGPDLFDYLRVGASAVQVAASYWKGGENPRVFSDILTKYIDQLPEAV